MNKVKLTGLIQDGNIVIPFYIFKLYKKFNLTLDEFIILMYLNNKNGTLFDPAKISEDLNMDLMEVMGYVSVLTDKGFVTLDVKKEQGVLEEKIDLSNFYDKISMSLIEDLNTEEKVDKSIYDIIELEFNRKLTPLECEVVKDWEDNYNKELITEALKEASLNGVSNLRYIDKILFEWNKKGIKGKNDLTHQPTNKDEKVEIFNCDWLEEDDE